MFKSVQRTAHKVGSKRSADQQDVGSVIAEFQSTDEMLSRLEKDLTIWANGWQDILKYQYEASEAFSVLYKPIEPPPEPSTNRSPPVQTPRTQMQSCLGLQKVYSDLRTDLAQEIGMIDNKVVRPVKEAKLATKSLQKTLKHRENMKTDYERFLSRAEHARKKEVRNMKEEAALAKHEGDLQQAQIDYQTADDQVKQYFPPVIEAIQALLPYILTSQIEIQTTLVGQLYTTLDAYCREQQLPSPAPSDAEIVSVWDSRYTSLRKEWEGGSSLLRGGKAINLAMNVPEKDTSTYTGLGIRNKSSALVSRGKGAIPGRAAPPAVSGAYNASNGSGTRPLQIAGTGKDGEEEDAPPKPPRPGTIPPTSMRLGASPLPSPGIPANKPRMPSYSNLASNERTAHGYPVDRKSPGGLIPTYPAQPPPAYSESQASTPSAHYTTPPNGLSRVNSHNDYFTTVNTGMPQLNRQVSSQSVASSVASIVAAKKKPPPPVPVKRIGSTQGTYVTALYDFDGQTVEDLPFREGDRIRVIKRTDSTDDWWEGEVNGRKGSFPANYVQL
ncbi:Putative SH3 domain, BAR domain, AH/BAR domain superfamily, SH3-like domain superfamily protein [Septoria linicola]|uniref:SH3 domain, BAR domain, AH/BAR domain superfamily, SH3-like domain superfamily protein n=1 Tax=Septoria linicola TaxID=215465 RepID=A0A9Q9ASX2_9PEZI|nr:putative SH3 domain, BAR domain, AH/BAR domain superfamily, SH3-like domain superfamily protein [Septoria linicola]USW52598.1 Putative SH3 domain, BAR domain, AH/BAR domain superfamily, SH3-like domain superfamily protein [Septoria linicola]